MKLDRRCRLLGRGRIPNFNKGRAVYLYIVHTHGLELSAAYPNKVTPSEHLGISTTTVFNYIKNRTLFEVNGMAHMVSWDGNLS